MQFLARVALVAACASLLLRSGTALNVFSDGEADPVTGPQAIVSSMSISSFTSLPSATAAADAAEASGSTGGSSGGSSAKAKPDDTPVFALYFFWGTVLLTGVAHNVKSSLTASHASRNSAAFFDTFANNEKKSTLERVSTMAKSHILIPATFGHRHFQPVGGWLTIPTRLQSIVIITSVGLNAIVAVSTFHNGGTLEDFLNRLGVLMLANMPFIWLFAGRNNIFLQLAGWRFRTFNIFHRWIARTVVLLVFFHAFGYTISSIQKEGAAKFAEFFAIPKGRLGLVAGTSFFLLGALAAQPIRRKFYEVFRATHVLLAAASVAGAYYHVGTNNPSRLNFLWTVVGLWTFDYSARLLRLGLLNTTRLFNRRSCSAWASFRPQSGVIELQVQQPTFMPSPKPGAHYFLYFGGGFHWLESRPFSLAAWNSTPAPTSRRDIEVGFPPSSQDTLTGSSRGEAKSAGATTVLEHVPSNASTATTIAPANSSNTLTFYIRPQAGMTSRLASLLARASPSPSSAENVLLPNLLLEGPYGNAAFLGSYAHVLFLAGGSGITAILPYLLTAATASPPHPSSSPAPQTLHLAWLVPQRSFAELIWTNHLAEIIRTFEADPFAAGRLRIEIFVTGDSVSSDADSLRSASGRKIMPFTYGKPDVGALVASAAFEPGAYRGNGAAVLACGPPRMADAARGKVVELMREGNKTGMNLGKLELFEESYGW